jgi:hypothetical protein
MNEFIFKPENLKKEEKLSYQEARKIASKLLEKYEQQIKANIAVDVDNLRGLVFEDYQDSIQHFLDSISSEDRGHYSGHGIIRGDVIDRLAAALSIMANKSISGDAGPISRRGQLCAFTRGVDFLIISKFNQSLIKKEGEDIVFDDQGNWKAEIGAVVVNTHFYPMIDEFKKMYPDVNIIKANQLPDFFAANANKDKPEE